MLSPDVMPQTWQRQSWVRNPVLRWALWLGVYLLSALTSMEINWSRLMEGIPRGYAFALAFFPPDFLSRADSILSGIFESIWMTVTSISP